MFINCTAHELTKEQMGICYGNGYGQIYEFKELAPDLFQQLSNCPGDKKEVMTLVEKFYLWVMNISLNDILEKDEKVYLHLPIGSPYFMFEISKRIGNNSGWIKFIFSHSPRQSVDEVQEDGSVLKKAIFKFSHFIEA